MFKKSQKSNQLDLFNSPSSVLKGRSLDTYTDINQWHNIFRQQVTMQINEDIFEPLFSNGIGAPNASLRVLVAMMVLKEAEGISDKKLFENCEFNLLIRSAIGLMNLEDSVPTESTYYAFRKRISEYAKAHNENLFDKAFSELTKKQCSDFNVSGKSLRMDSKLLGSNIAWLSRYEIIHETTRLFWEQIKEDNKLNDDLKKTLGGLLKEKGYKVVFANSSDEVKDRLQQFGILISQLLETYSGSEIKHYETLRRVFSEQYKVDDKKTVLPREKEKIKATSVQSPHDTDSHYRNKDGNQVKGFSINITESCDDGDTLNLISDVNVKQVSSSDSGFLEESIERSTAVFKDIPTAVHADGAYHSQENQKYCKKNNIELFLHAIQGQKGRYLLNYNKEGKLAIYDSVADQNLDYKELTDKKGERKWRIKQTKGYRYFTQKDIDNSLLREKINKTPIEILQKRNNVEATIFQLGYHYPNAKSRYRGLIKHQMWADIRCMWINFVRILGKAGRKANYYYFMTLFLNGSRMKFAIPQLIVANLSVWKSCLPARVCIMNKNMRKLAF